MSQNKCAIGRVLEKYKGQAVAILCMRYWYRGVVAEIDEDVVTLSSPKAVELTGVATGAAPQTEDEIPCDLHINCNAIEIICQPAWVWHHFESLKKAAKK